MCVFLHRSIHVNTCACRHSSELFGKADKTLAEGELEGEGGLGENL